MAVPVEARAVDVVVIKKIWIALLFLIPFPTSAETSQEEAKKEKLVVAVKSTGPFAYKGKDQRWRGISIDLWKEIAKELKLTYEFHEVDLKGMLEGMEKGSFDVAVGALTVTREREEKFDFTHPFTSSGLGIAVRPESTDNLSSILARILSFNFLKVILVLAAVLFSIGFLLWFFERKKNPEQFGGSTSRGLGAAFWWSAVTMTTVGYGDKSPASIGGRVIAILWMFASIMLISGFTAAIASSLTVQQLSSSIEGPEDLRGTQVGSVTSSTSAAYLENDRVIFQKFKNTQEALDALDAGKLDAVIYDQPILRFLTKKNRYKRVTVLHPTFERQDYAFGLPAKSPLREPINHVLIERLSSDWWKETLQIYIGQ